MEEGTATLLLAEYGRVELDRAARRAVYVTPTELDDDELAHPYLAHAAAYFAAWDGRLSLHAGAFATGGRAFGVIGDKEQGKSTLLASLHLAGSSVVADDVLVIAGGACYPGPRSVDLREAAADRLPIPAGELRRARFDTRFRLELPPLPPEPIPLAGWIFLRWGDLGVRRVSIPETLRRLNDQRILRTTADDPRELFELVAQPGLELSRPRDWGTLTEATDRLLAAVG